ncbi:MAG: RNA polymerase sigma-70 factor [Dysgonamonadaceae bacterium]|nr:RNA polymerase sigma-70 factor [Dysgonamonadaceae bacterium]MDD3495125.1 RNA polymerase sigma-70 factor [Dysgonamonadaceae bacterium]MDD4378877.1 RNA polymerase sigma-70 factor [Dysgonamonadaceae bacterium]
MEIITIEQFEKLYLQQAPKLIFYARKFVDDVVAEDIVHDIFLKLWQKKPEIDFSNEDNPYLFRMVRNACYDFLKHKAVEKSFLDKAFTELKIEELEWSDSHETFFEQEEKINAIYTIIDGLPPRCKEIFVKAYLEEQKHSDIATQLNISVRTVDTQVYKALKIIRDHLIPVLVLLFSLF